MDNEVIFYYDESAHSRRITVNTVNQENFEPFFCTTIVGIEKNKYSFFENDFLSFEKKWKKKFGMDGELKSSIVAKKKYKFGIKSFNLLDTEFYNDFFEIILKYNLYINIGLISKIEYITRQLIEEIKGPYNRNAICYTITKSLCAYHPYEVISKIINCDKDAIDFFKDFLRNRKRLNKRNNGEAENSAFSILEEYLDNFNEELNINWNYQYSFIGFKKFIYEHGITNYSMIIDNEGDGKTINTAIDKNITNVKGEDSKNSIGIRCADIISGFINNMVNSILSNVNYKEDEIGSNPKLLEKEWFDIEEKNFSLYKKTFDVFIGNRPSFYKITSLIYADGIIYFNALLNFFNSFNSFEDYIQTDVSKKQNKLNDDANTDLIFYYRSYLEKNFIFTEPEDLNYQFLYDYKNKNFGDDNYSMYKMPLPLQNEKVVYLILDFIINVIGENKLRIIKVSESGKDIYYECPGNIINWFDRQYIFNKDAFIYPRVITIINNNNKLDFIPLDVE